MTKRTAVKLDEADEASGSKKQSSTAGKENQLLANMMQYLMQGKEAVSFKKSAVDLDFMERTKTWRAAWKNLIDDGLIEPCDSGGSTFTADHKLTQKGKDHAATDEYKEYIKDMEFQPATNEEHQARIKKRLLNIRGVQIFDLLLEHGSLSRYELSGILGVSDRTHKFSYALQQLKQKEYVEMDASGKKKYRLADKAFLTPEDRPELQQSDQEAIAELIAASAKAKIVKKNGQKKTKSSESEPKEKEQEAIPDKVSSNPEHVSSSTATSKKAVKRQPEKSPELVCKQE